MTNRLISNPGLSEKIYLKEDLGGGRKDEVAQRQVVSTCTKHILGASARTDMP